MPGTALIPGRGLHKRSHPLSQGKKFQLMAGKLEQIPEWDSVSSAPTICEEQ